MNKDKVKNLFLWFLAGMMFFGVVSRAADSVRIARVEADSPKSSSLSYEIYGSGTVIGKAGKTISAVEGLRISKVYKKAGDQVKADDKLFAYDKDHLTKACNRAKRTYESARIAYEKAGMTTGGAGNGAPEEALEGFNQEEKELALEDARQKLEDKKEAIQNDKKEAYKKAKEEYEDAATAMEEELKNAARATEDAKAAYQKLMRTEEEIKARIGDLKSAVLSGNETAISDRKEDVARYYFGEAYESHREEVKKAEKNWKRAQEDLQDYLMSGEDLSEQEKKLRRDVVDAKETLDVVKEDDIRLDERMQEYQKALLASNQSGTESSYQLLYQMLYQSKKVDETAIAEAKKAWERGKEDETSLKAKWEEELSEKEEARDEAEIVYDMVVDGTYDYTDETRDEETEIRQAERACEQEQLNQNVKAEEEREEREAARTAREQGLLDAKAAYLSVEEARENWEALQRILNAGGLVTSPTDGLITNQEIQEGSMTTGSERILLSLDCYQFEAMADAEGLLHFEEGDAISLSKDGEQENQEFSINSISGKDSSGYRKVTVLLPKDGFIEGETLFYEAKKESEGFDCCIPISALRKDNSGTYVYVIMKKKGILGEEEYLIKTAVSVLSKDTKKAALAQRMEQDVQIVTGSNKAVAEKDRVRIYEEVE